MKVVQKSNAPTFYLYLFTVSVFIKVGTTNPVVTPIFKDYVDIARTRIIKYIYLQTAKPNTVRLNFNATTPIIIPTTPAAGHVQLVMMDTTDSSNLKLISWFPMFTTGGGTFVYGNNLATHTKSLLAGYHAIK